MPAGPVFFPADRRCRRSRSAPAWSPPNAERPPAGVARSRGAEPLHARALSDADAGARGRPRGSTPARPEPGACPARDMCPNAAVAGRTHERRAAAPAGRAVRHRGCRAATLRRVERAAGTLATQSVALMDERLPWFRALPADQRSWVTLVAQAGISGYVAWATPGTDHRIADAVFGTAPRDLVRAVSLRRTVELVRIAITVAEDRLPALAADEDEAVALRDSLRPVQPRGGLRRRVRLRHRRGEPRRLGRPGRGRARRRRGARRGPGLAGLPGGRAELGPGRRHAGRRRQRAPRRPRGIRCGRGGMGRRAGPRRARRGARRATGRHPGRHRRRPARAWRPSSATARWSAAGRAAACAARWRPPPRRSAGLDVAAAWPAAPRPVDADDLLPERALAGDPARRSPGCGRRSTPRWPPHRPRCCAPWTPTWRRAARSSPPRGRCSCTRTPCATGCTASPR